MLLINGVCLNDRYSFRNSCHNLVFTKFYLVFNKLFVQVEVESENQNIHQILIRLKANLLNIKLYYLSTKNFPSFPFPSFNLVKWLQSTHYYQSESHYSIIYFHRYNQLYQTNMNSISSVADMCTYDYDYDYKMNTQRYEEGFS